MPYRKRRAPRLRVKTAEQLKSTLVLGRIDGSVPATIDEETYFGVPSVLKGEDTYLDFELQHQFLDNLKLVVRGSHQETDFDYQTGQGASNYAGGRGFGPGDTGVYVYYSMGYRDTEVKYSDVQLVGGFEAFRQNHDWVIGTSHQETKFSSYWAPGGGLGVADINDDDAKPVTEMSVCFRSASSIGA